MRACPDTVRPQPSGYRSHQSSSQDFFAQLCGDCRRRCVSGYGLRFCTPGRLFSAAACTASINACLRGCERRYCRRDGR
jgi:hypothetical protein